MPRTLADIVRRISRGYDIPTREAAALLGRPIFTIALDDLTDEEATDVFVLRPSWGKRTSAGVAGQFSRVQLFNPASSGVVLVVLRFLVTVDGSMSVDVGGTTTQAGVVGGDVAFRDSRITGAPVCVMTADSNAAQQVTPVLTGEVTAGGNWDYAGLDFILAAGAGVVWEGNTVNTAFHVNAIWREETA